MGSEIETGDFNADGRTDLAVRVAGAVRVFQGPISRSGATGPVSTIRAEHTVIGGFTVGDFDGDGRSDIIYSETNIPEVITDPDDIHVHFRRGTPTGLKESGIVPVALPLKSPITMAAGDIDHDGRDDFVISQNTGVTVYYGEQAGPGATRKPTVVSEATAGVPGSVESWDSFGAALTVGDVNGDHYADLAVGNPAERLGSNKSINNGGVITLLHGSAKGLTTTGVQAFSQDSPGVPGHAESGDRFGSGLLLSDVNRDGRADLTAAAIGENGTGMVWTFPGTATNLTSVGSTYFGAPSRATDFGIAIAG